jgi:hypothetical protein
MLDSEKLQQKYNKKGGCGNQVYHFLHKFFHNVKLLTICRKMEVLISFKEKDVCLLALSP